MKQVIPLASTSAIVAIWPRRPRISRSSLRSRAEISGTMVSSPPQLAGARALGDAPLGLDAAVGQRHHPIGDLGDGRVVGDDGGRRAELAVDALDDVEDQDAG